ncbi:hypothetical protein [Gemmatimonas sp.]|uniref:hypothetical protein n=1 Tax=Gemmatimonas sp. TaxID=1962908 RepID=UPI00333E662F
MSVISPKQAPSRSVVVDAMNNPALDWTRDPATRRRLVLASVATTVVVTGMLYSAATMLDAERPQANAWTMAAAVATMLGWMLLTGCLNASVRGAADPLVATLPGGHDEWQRRLYDQTYRRCYWPMLILLSLAILVLSIGDLPVIEALGVFLATFLLAVMAPLWTMAWTLPDDLREPGSE